MPVSTTDRWRAMGPVLCLDKGLNLASTYCFCVVTSRGAEKFPFSGHGFGRRGWSG